MAFELVISHLSMLQPGEPSVLSHLIILSTDSLVPCILPWMVPVLAFFTKPVSNSSCAFSCAHFVKLQPWTLPKTSKSADAASILGNLLFHRGGTGITTTGNVYPGGLSETHYYLTLGLAAAAAAAAAAAGPYYRGTTSGCSSST